MLNVALGVDVQVVSSSGDAAAHVFRSFWKSMVNSGFVLRIARMRW